MSNTARVRIACTIALLATGCASQQPCAAPSKAVAPPTRATPATPVPPPAKTSVAEPPAQLHETFVTTLSPKDAVDQAAKAVHDKLGLLMKAGGGNNYFSNYNPAAIASDHLSATLDILTQAGKTMRIEFEWLAEGKTEVILDSDLPKAQYDLVVKIVRDADLAGRR